MGDSAAKALVAAGALFTDGLGRVLMVQPTYKSYWDIPGGHVKPGESPRDACVREVHEELGIRPPIGGLLVVDWAPHPEEGDKILFLFDGGRLDDAAHSRVRFADGEIDRYAYVAVEMLVEFTIPRLVRRLEAGVAALGAGVPAYLERGLT